MENFEVTVCGLCGAAAPIYLNCPRLLREACWCFGYENQAHYLTWL
ncbi:hypothetical protein CEV33_3202 [Brucella grignonensis]|uniref:Uncharacterized protein n=1 Tax=Brucella grignonensis TaxID=94627 RepID=A0A256F162_9HYPH|nr:hypothetical protein CEV33_3202 [Brucella grignonensis]